ncbi:MAG: rhomboid family intramembrane serine protease [Holophaga sp.]
MVEAPEGPPSGKACPVCHTPVEAWARICPRCEHEWPVTPEEVEDHALLDFQGTLRTLTPRFWVTPLLMGLNILVFGVMVVAGVHFLSPTSESLVRWGADFGPLTSNGQWWRLVSATFLHVGIIHLAFNMYVLWDIGGLVERLVGNAAFLALYLLAGVFGSLASLIWNPLVVSAGASGAVFGLFGVLLAFLLRHRHSIPAEVLGKLRKSALAFLGYNLLFSLRPGVDMAAHLGGLLGGFTCAWFAVQPLTSAGAAKRQGAILRVGLVAVAVILAVIAVLPPSGSLRAAGVQSRSLKTELARFEHMEGRTVDAFNTGFQQYRDGTLADAKFAELLEQKVLPEWRESRQRLAGLRNLSPRETERVAELDRYLEVREREWTLFIESIRQQDGRKANLALEAHGQAERMAQALVKAWTAE